MRSHKKPLAIRIALLSLSVMVAIPFSLLFSGQQASAAPSASDAKQQAKMYTFYKTLEGCSLKALKDVIGTSSSNVESTDPSTWFDGWVTAYVYPSGVSKSCKDIMQDTASTWGSSTDYGNFLEAAGYSLNRSAPEYKWSSGNEQERSNRFMGEILKRSPGINNISDAAKYQLYLGSLMGSSTDCKGEDAGIYGSPELAKTDYQSWADNHTTEGDYVFTKVKMADGDHAIKVLSNPKVIVYGWEAHRAFTGEKDLTCRTIADRVSQYANAFILEQAKISCQTTGPKFTAGNEISACADGYANRTAAVTYCSDRYSDTDQIAERNACFVGQGNGGGPDCIEGGYTSFSLLAACIQGSKNKANVGFCDSAYPAPDTSNPGDPKAALRKACLVGASDQVSTPGIEQPTLSTKTDCATTPDDEACKKAKNSCDVPGMGWIVCPAMSFLGDVADNSYTFIAKFLETNVNIFNTSDPTKRATYDAWSIMRNIANVAFVIAFLIIIYSQLTSAGVSNYGIKKMLPRLIAAAILVNLSFFICQVAVDLSNILGASIKGLFEGISIATAGSSPLLRPDENGNGAGIATIVALSLAGGILFVSTLAPILLVGVVAILMIFLLLLFRQAAIILLIVIAPLAFVAFLLPNTQKMFDRWRKMFVTLLMLYPIIALVFGATGLASDIIKNTASGGSADNTQQQLTSIVAVGAALVPLFVVPVLLKGSLTALGTVGTKLNGFGDKMQGSARNRGKSAYDNSRLGQYKKYREGERNLRRAAIQSGTFEGHRLDPRTLMSRVNKNINQASASGKFGDRALTQGVSLADKEDAEFMQNATSRLDNMRIPDSTGAMQALSQDQMMEIAKGGSLMDGSGNVVLDASSIDSHTRRAAIQKAAKIATVDQAHELVDVSASMSVSERKTLSAAMAGSSALTKAPYLGGRTLGEIEQGTATSDKAALNGITAGKITAEALASSDKDAVKKLVAAALTTAVGSKERDNLKEALNELYKPGSRLKEKIVKGGDHDIELQKITTL